MTGRRDLFTAEPVEDKERHGLLVEKWLTPEWLSIIQSHPLRDLWKRYDWISTTELLTLGTALESLLARAHAGWLENASATVRRPDVNNMAGSLFEVLAAYMLNKPDHPVELAPVGARGYDMTVHIKGYSLRISCKVLMPSRAYSDFASHWEKTGLEFGHATVRSQPTHVILTVRDCHHYEPKLETLLSLREMWLRTGQSRFELEEAAVDFEAPQEAEVRCLSRQHPAYGLTALTPYAQYEQKRFSDKVEEASAGLRAHCAGVSRDVGNAILVKIPVSISMSLAAGWLRELLKRDFSHVSAVMIYRSALTGQGTWDVLPTYELHTVTNPRALQPLDDLLNIRLVIPYGQLATGVPVVARQKNGKLEGVGDYYIAVRGERFYDEALRPDPSHVSRRLFGQAVTLVRRLRSDFVVRETVHPYETRFVVI